MKTFIIALIGTLGLTLGTPAVQARDKDHHRHYRSHHSSDRHHHYRSSRSYPRSYSYRSYSYPRYYSYPRTYGYYGNPYHGHRYYSRRPAITFSFGL